MMQPILTSHIGYETHGPKQAVLKGDGLNPSAVTLHDAQSHQPVLTIAAHYCGPVSCWHQGTFYRADFSSFSQPGRYYLQCDQARSAIFEISDALLMKRTYSDVIHYFKSQRCSGVYDRYDHHVSLFGSHDQADVHGGWYDASGDVSKYLSHLSYASYFNPQQTPAVVWCLLESYSLIADEAPFLRQRVVDEALYGADFLMRMQHPQGYFFMTVFDQWSKIPVQREICAYQTQKGVKSSDYQAGFRQGGGMAIAALARAARCGQTGDFPSREYLSAAAKGYQHLKSCNRAYLNDGTENIIDEYCALLASCELFLSQEETDEGRTHYLSESRHWAVRLAERQQSDDQYLHFWSANQDGSRPYFHAVEAGLPVIALCRYLDIEPDPDLRVQAGILVERACRFELAITSETNNPFGYPRQYVRPVNEVKQSAFFIPHQNETGYWWQGENARLASLAAMAYQVQPWISDPRLRQALESYAQNILNWVTGLNPFDICMLDGHGHNNPNYLPGLGFHNAKGGICNGITSGFNDETDIAFNPALLRNSMELN